MTPSALEVAPPRHSVVTAAGNGGSAGPDGVHGHVPPRRNPQDRRICRTPTGEWRRLHTLPPWREENP